MRKLILATTLLAPASSFAGGYIVPNANARDLGLSSAATADQNGPEALFLNPSELAGLDGLGISASGSLIVNRTTWSDPNNGSASLVPQYTPPPSAVLSFGAHLNHDMAIGIGAGVDVPAGGALVWPNGWQGQEYIQSVKQQVFRIGAGVGFQPIPAVKIGATFLRYQATEELHQSLNFLDHEGDGQLGMSAGASSFGLGLAIHVPTVPLSLGVNYTHSGTLHLEGNAHFTNVPPSFTPLIHDQAVTEELHIPNVLQVGAAYAIVPNLSVMAAYTWERWTEYKEDLFVGSDGFSVKVPRNYNNAHVYRAAMEWKLGGFESWTTRLGALRSISSQPKDTVSPSLTDGNSTAVSIGAGFNVVPTFRIDFGYQHAWFDTVKATGTEAFPGSYDTHVDLFSLGIVWQTDLGLKHE